MRKGVIFLASNPYDFTFAVKVSLLETNIIWHIFLIIFLLCATNDSFYFLPFFFFLLLGTAPRGVLSAFSWVLNKFINFSSNDAVLSTG